MVHDVFIGHAHKDKSVADAICERLESAGVRCWIAGRDISAGEDWTEATRNAIGSSRVMVLLLSENANSAPHIQREIAHAFYTKRIIIPLRLTNTLPSRDFLFYLGNVRWFDAFSSPAEEHLELDTQPASAIPSSPSDDQKPVGEGERLGALDTASARSVQEDTARISSRRQGRQAKSRSKSHSGRDSKSQGLRFADIKSRLRRLWHQIVARSK
jgi:hypothetical protein